MDVRGDGKKYCFICEMEAMSPLVIQTGLSCDVVEMEAYSTGRDCPWSAPGPGLAPNQNEGVKLISLKQ